MRILMLTSAYHPHKGGVEEIVRQLARAYQKEGQQVLVMAPRWPHSLPAAESIDGQLVRRIPMPMPSRHCRSAVSFFLRFLPSVMSTLSVGWRWRPDLLHVHCVGPNGLYGLILARVFRLPLIVTSYGEQTVDAGRVYERSTAQRWVLRRLLRQANWVTSDSANALGNLEPYGFSPSAGTVHHNGIDLGEFQRAAPASPHERPYIFAIGRHVPTKGFDVLLRAYAWLAARHAGIDLVLAGDGPEHERLVALTADLGLADRVRFAGRTDRVATVTYFKHCRLFVLPSLRESFPVVNLEAMAAGKPVVVTRVGGVAELVHDGQNGLVVPPSDVDALAAAIERLLCDPAYAAALAEAGARRVREEHSWTNVAAGYLALYRRILAGNQTAVASNDVPASI